MKQQELNEDLPQMESVKPVYAVEEIKGQREQEEVYLNSTDAINQKKFRRSKKDRFNNSRSENSLP